MNDEASIPQQVNALLLRAWATGHSADQVALTEEAVRLADSHGDVSLTWEAREALIEAATFAGYPEKALLAFSWCLGLCDKEPDRFQEQRLLWQYKWVAADLPYFPQIERQRILDIHEDMTRRYERCGQSLQPIYKVRWLAAMRMGDREQAKAFYAKALETQRDAGSDCDACDLDDAVVFQVWGGELARAVETAKPILAGSLSCASVPHVTHACLLRPLLRLRRTDEAMRSHVRGFALVSGNRKFVDAIGDHIEFLTLTENLERAARALGENVDHALTTTDLDDRFRFYTAATLLCTRLSEEARPPAVQLPGRFPLADPSPAELQEWFATEARGLAERFDARNGNSSYVESLDEALGLLKTLRTPAPVPSDD